MTCAFHAAGNVELYFYAELSAAGRAEMQAHLKQCAICRGALDDLSMIRAALASRPDVATPPGGDWSGFMTRLDSALRESPAVAPQPSRVSRGLIPFARRHHLATYAAMAAVLTLVTAGVLTLKTRQDRAAPAPGVVAAPAPEVVAPPSASPVVADHRPDPAFEHLSGAHFQRSKLVVLSLSTREAGLQRADWSRERELATSLLNDTRVYRLAAEERGMNSLAGVMRDLELVLLQTSMSEGADPASLEQLQRLIRRRDLVTKMNTIASASP